MRTTARRTAGAVCAALVMSATAEGGSVVPARVQRPARPDPNPCVESGASPIRSPRLIPVDEAASQPAFFSFRAQLQAAVARRDAVAVLAAADPGIRTSFGSESGLEAFRRALRDPEGTIWEELGAVLALGGSFRAVDAFEAPYVYSRWPQALDSFECAAVVGDQVRVRGGGTAASPVVARLSYDIVRVFPNQAQAPADPQKVGLANGAAAFIARRFLRSPIDRRAIFQRTGRQWRLAAFVAGD